MKKILLLLTISTLTLTGCKSDSDDFSGTLFINSPSSLAEAVDLGNNVASLSGNLLISTGGNTGITATQVNKVTNRITSVRGRVSIFSPDGGINLENLTSVGGDYIITGSDPSDNSLRTVGGDITLDYPGSYEMANLESAGNIDLTPISSQSSSKGTLPNASINFPIVNAASISSIGHRDGMLDFNGTNLTDISLGAGIYIDYIVAPNAISINSEYPGALNSLFISAPIATSVNLSTSAINGDVNSTSGGSLTLNNVSIINGNVSITAVTITSTSLTQITGQLSCRTTIISLPSINVIGGNVEVTGITENSSAESVSFPNLSNVGGNLAIDADEVTQNTGQPHNSGGNNHNSGGN